MHEVGNNHELILYWGCDFVDMFKKETTLLINTNQLIVHEISKIDVIVGGNHSQCVFRFPMKLLFIMKSEIKVERISSVAYVLYKKEYDDILKNIIIENLQES